MAYVFGLKPIQRLFPVVLLGHERDEFTFLQLAGQFIPFSGADLKIPTNHSEEQYKELSVRLR